MTLTPSGSKQSAQNQNQRPIILVLTSTFPRWQDDTEPPFVLELCKSLNNRYQLLVLAPHAAGTQPFESIDGIQVERFRYAPEKWETLCYQGGIIANLNAKKWRYLLLPAFFVAQLLALLRVLRRENTSLIHAHWLIPQGLTASLAGLWSRTPAPVVCTSHGGDLLSLNVWPLNVIKQWVIRHSSFLTVVNAAMTNRALALGARPTCLATVSMGVDSLSTFTASTDVFRFNNEILFVGRLVEKKGLPYLLEAMPKILRLRPGVHLTIVGDGPNANALKHQAQTLGIAHAVDFIGAMANATVADHYRRATLLVAPSIITDQGDQEGLPVVLLEALACECPVVTTDIPATQGLLTHQQTAWIVPQRNSSLIASAVVTLLDAPELRLNLAKNAQEHVVKRYDWSNVATQYAEIFDQLLH